MVLILQERIAGLEAEMAEERHKCQRMVDQIRREIEAQATEVRAFPLNHQMYIQHTAILFLTEVYWRDEEKRQRERNSEQNHGKGYHCVIYSFDNQFVVVVYRRLNCIVTRQRQWGSPCKISEKGSGILCTADNGSVHVMQFTFCCSQLKVEIEADKTSVRPLVLLEKWARHNSAHDCSSLLQIFPRCLPDTELHLNIPVQDS